jgi:hypothetical protein
VNSVSASLARDTQQLLAVQVRARPAAAERLCLVSLAAVQRRLVVLGVDRQGGNAELIGSAGDANCDLAAVGDQEF